MEAPEKIYLQQYDEDTIICLNEWNISEEWTDKPCNEKIATNIEYTRTDTFIKKACKFLSNKANIPLWEGYAHTFGCDTTKLIENFKNYMKGK